MPCGTKISFEMQWVILRLSKFLKIDQIAMCVSNLSDESYLTSESMEPSRETQLFKNTSETGIFEMWILRFVFSFCQFEILNFHLFSTYLMLSINNWICTLMNSRKCSKLVVVPVSHNLPSGKHSDRLDS
jgi:hypothetical protein